MFERYAERAKKVSALAVEEARLQNLGFVGTEALLIALLREGDGVAAKALDSLGVSLDVVRQKVEETVGPPKPVGAGVPSLTPRAKRALNLARQEARDLGQKYVDTEHLLLGVVREGEGIAAQVLQSLGADLITVRGKVQELLQT